MSWSLYGLGSGLVEVGIQSVLQGLPSPNPSKGLMASLMRQLVSMAQGELCREDEGSLNFPVSLSAFFY